MADPASYRPQSIPTDPGVYRFYDEHGTVIYVGKARNLRSRLSSYFQSNLAEKTYRMVHTAVRVDWTIVNTEVEALQLEFTWIKSENPRFNIQFRDDKSYPFLAISMKDDFPRIFISRAKKRPGVKYFGPFAHTWALRSTFELLLSLYPIRSCGESNFLRAQRTGRQCLLGDIGKCAAPCVGWVSPEGHQELAKNLVKFLDSNPIDIVAQIEDQMHQAAAAQEYERAAKLRDQMAALLKASESTETALSENLNADVLATHEEITHAAVSIFSVRHGRVVGSRSWIIDRSQVLEDESIIESALPKIYSDSSPPGEVILESMPEFSSSLEEWLSLASGHGVTLTVPLRGEKVELIRIVKRNAYQSLVQYLSKRSNDTAVTGKALEEVAQALDLAEIPLRIECFDISNIQGTNMVASMVVFEDGQPKKSEYRRFAISEEAGFDDTRAMHHVLTRRLKRYLSEKDIDLDEVALSGGARPKFSYRPHLIVVDGGAPQVAAAARVLEELGIANIALCGLAKRLEEVWLPGSADPVIFPRHSEGLYLLQRVRDEAHRFAITFHRSKRSRVMLESLLDEIPQLGQSRRQALLEHFGSVSALRKASLSDISAIPGIGEKIAGLILEHLPQAVHGVNLTTGEVLDS
ncbi:MAG: excinuclease ABC subunit UvrC [Actinomycetes bacterium]